VPPVQAVVPPVQAVVPPVQAVVPPVQAVVPPVQAVVPPDQAIYHSPELSTVQTHIFNLIQNNLNQKVIDHTTLINISVESLDLYRQLNYSAMVQQQLSMNMLR
jgi:hypothetical protein